MYPLIVEFILTPVSKIFEDFCMNNNELNAKRTVALLKKIYRANIYKETLKKITGLINLIG